MPTESLVAQMEARKVELCNELTKMLADHKAERSAVDPATLPDDEARSVHATSLAESDAAFGASFDKKEAEIKDIETRIAQEKVAETRAQDAAKSAPARVTSEPLTYRKDNAHEISYFADLYANFPGCSQPPRNSSRADARGRLEAHDREMRVELPKRTAERERRANAAIYEGDPARGFRGISAREFRHFEGEIFERGAAVAGSSLEQRVNPSTTAGQGGEFIPPLWLEQDFIPYLRAGRVISDIVRQVPLPAGTDSINLPKVSTPTLVAPQGANNAPVTSQDIKTTSVNTGVKTIAGQEDVALQLLELSQGGLTDRVITEDLMAAYNLNLDSNVVVGTGPNTGTGGGLLGLYPTSNWSATAVTWTQATPNAATGMFPTLGAMASQIAQSRFDNSNIHYACHPRRGYWFVTQLDGAASRPFVESSGFSPFQPGAIEELDVAQGLLARLPWGPSLHISSNVPTTDSSGTPGGGTADVLIALKADDVWLFEGEPRVRVLSEILSGTLQVRFQIYNYVGMIQRYGGSVAIATGTGLAAPTTGVSGNY